MAAYCTVNHSWPADSKRNFQQEKLLPSEEKDDAKETFYSMKEKSTLIREEKNYDIKFLDTE
jgi:hypothetical protein